MIIAICIKSTNSSNVSTDRVLDPPRTPEEVFTDDPSIIDEIESDFAGNLSEGWNVVYYQTDMEKRNELSFLCLNWAKWRLSSVLKPSKPVPNYVLEGTVDYSTDALVESLLAWSENKLVECKKGDSEKARNPPPQSGSAWQLLTSLYSSVGHISVRHGKFWESKVSALPYVITHGENDYEHFLGGMVATAWLKMAQEEEKED
ncbi:uncharacterized protein PAC_14912 [Phialocephala subalpina]|uniref:Uncharacterized protein n=1 Tax=Phialocephala subalpina TaxID=576137 RepID=A0A1L7XIZ7_9HELO|nr:uncharacterized protein PAC_14912 [Phialocephala subalpina]